MIVDPLLPAPAELLGHGSFQLRIAPKRRAFLVRDGDVDQLRRAFLAAAALWGGARCPILPVTPAGQVQAGFLQIAEVLDVVEVVDFTVDGTGGASAWTERDGCALATVVAKPLADARFWNAHPLVGTLDGYAATRAIRALQQGADRRLPIIAFTASPDADERQHCLAAGMDDFLVKPAELDVLAATLNRWTPP